MYGCSWVGHMGPGISHGRILICKIIVSMAMVVTSTTRYGGTMQSIIRAAMLAGLAIAPQDNVTSIIR